jgi:cytochrome b subunit of formate dehydrogenase
MSLQKPLREQRPLSGQTRRNWLIASVNVLGGLVAGASGIYFLWIPSGGYQGGRNPYYSVTVLFSRQTWDLLHTWGGVAMIVALVVHFAIHWEWVVMMARSVVNALRSKGKSLSRGSQLNVAINLAIALSFLVTALSGITFLFVQGGGYRGGANPGWDPNFLFSRTTWDLIHTWAGVAFLISAVAHFVIHWRWVKNVTLRMAGRQRPGTQNTLVSQRTQPLA